MSSSEAFPIFFPLAEQFSCAGLPNVLHHGGSRHRYMDIPRWARHMVGVVNGLDDLSEEAANEGSIAH